ncbi:TRAP transporter large permease [Chloroflexota bacterium]
MVSSLVAILGLYLGVLFGLLSLGMWFGVTVGAVGVLSFVFLIKGANIHLFVLIIYNQLRSFTLTAVPLFIFLGEILLHTGIGQKLYRGLMGIMQGIPGGLLHVNVWSCALLAAASGSSPATVATMASVSVPELERLGYNRQWSLGTVTVAGSLGLMIPPSVALIIYGFMTETSVVRLFTAGIIPGILLAVLFSTVILVKGIQNPAALGGERITIGRGQVLKDALGIVPILLLIGIVLGSIYAGVATPTESAALGCVGAVGVAASYRYLTRDGMIQAVRETVIVMGTIGFIIVGALAMSYSVSHLGLGTLLVRWVESLDIPPIGVLFMLYLVYILLGCVMESLALLLIIVPIAFPVVVGLGYDPVWFGIVVVVGQELACITPPIGVNLWVMQGITGEPIERLARAVLPFFFVLVGFLVVLTFIPQLATWLPDLLFG